MQIKPFKLERYFARYEFKARYLLSSSDCQALSLQAVLDMADEETRVLWHDLQLGYTESEGHPLLRQEIASLYPVLKAENTLTLTPEEGIFLAVNAILKAGDGVICMYPGYQSLYEVARSLGGRVALWKPQEENGWRFNPEHLEKLVNRRTKLLVINFPHNPTGILASHSDFKNIMEIAAKNDLIVLSDEMYRGLEYDKRDRLPAACQVYPGAVSLGGMSKSYGLAGVRTGWLATEDAHLLKKIAALKDYTTICSSAPSEILALMVLRARERVLKRQLQLLEHNLGCLHGFMQRQKDRFSWTCPKAGTIAFPRLNSGRGAALMCRRAVQEAGVMVLPSTVYGYGDAHIRVGFGRDNFGRALEKFEAWMDNRGL
jgi:aspartate/methionine/tyrosine aminotransferase